MRAIILPAAAAAALLLAGCDRQSGGGSQANDASPGTAGRAGSLAGVDRTQAGKPMPDVGFREPDGGDATLAQFKGRPLLVNLWATWCAPCVKELPTLAALSAERPDLQVLALSQDMQGQQPVADFLKERKVALEPYQDAEMAMSTALGANILPTTVLYGSDGREVWRYTGDLDWTGAKAAKLLTEAR